MSDKRKFWDYLYRLIIIGDSFAGKSSIMNRFTDEDWSASYFSTVALDFKVRSVVHDGKKIKLQIYDTAGQERFRTITRAYYRNCSGCLVVYDASERESFEHVQHWIKELNTYANVTPVTYVIGNKIDLIKTVQTEEGKTLADKFGYKFFETSAKENIGVDLVFKQLVEDMFRKSTATKEVVPELLKILPPDDLDRTKKKTECCK